MLATRAADAHAALVYVNQVGGQDELVFDGCSLAFDAEGNLLARGPQFVENLFVVDVPIAAVYRQRLLDPRGREPRPALPRVVVTAEPALDRRDAIVNPVAAPLEPVAELYEALVLGTRDYCVKNGFSDVVIALSGGIDSTIVAVIAADALGAEHVHGVSMPSRYSSDHSRSDAAAAGRKPRHRLPHDLDRARVQRVPRHARAELRRATAGADAGEPAEPVPRPGADGAVERVRLDGADHRQQERDGGGLLHALRRLGRRVRRHQGRAQDRASTTCAAT